MPACITVSAFTIDLNGFPRGSKIAQKAQGEIFKHVTLNRGHPMNAASES